MSPRCEMTRELSKSGCVSASLSLWRFQLKLYRSQEGGSCRQTQNLAIILINSGLLYELKYLEKGTHVKTFPISKREGWGEGGGETAVPKQIENSPSPEGQKKKKKKASLHSPVGIRKGRGGDPEALQ